MTALRLDRLVKLMSLAGISIIFAFFIYLYNQGALSSTESLQVYMMRLGIWAPIMSLIIQIAQTIIPLFPATLTIPMGTLLFGDINGLALNFIGIVIGSFINFYLARNYGSNLVEKLVGADKFQQGTAWLDRGPTFKGLFIFANVQPFAPGDLMCYIAGVSNITPRFFTLTVLFGKFTTLLMYLVGTRTLVEFLFTLF